MKLPSFDYANTLAAAVGNDGLGAGDLDERAAAGAVTAFRARVESGEIGFPTLPDDRTTLRAIEQFARGAARGIDDVLVLGIGGSALSAYALDVAMRGPHPVQRVGKRAPRPRLVVLDNVDPGFVTA